MSENLLAIGYFWLPGEQKRIPGQLEIKDGRVKLELTSELDSYHYAQAPAKEGMFFPDTERVPPDGNEYDVVLGDLNLGLSR